MIPTNSHPLTSLYPYYKCMAGFKSLNTLLKSGALNTFWQTKYVVKNERILSTFVTLKVEYSGSLDWNVSELRYIKLLFSIVNLYF